MKPITQIFIALMLLAITDAAAGQSIKQKQETAPPYIYVTPEMTRMQIDSLTESLKQFDIILEFKIIEYDSSRCKITNAAGTVNHLRSNSNASFNADEFKGLTIFTLRERTGVGVGIMNPGDKSK
jgi:hypothetical protein